LKRKEKRNIHMIQASFGPDVVCLQQLVALVDMGVGMGVVVVAVNGVVVVRGDRDGGVVDGSSEL
jgi:hypothetical protein